MRQTLAFSHDRSLGESQSRCTISIPPLMPTGSSALCSVFLLPPPFPRRCLVGRASPPQFDLPSSRRVPAPAAMHIDCVEGDGRSSRNGSGERTSDQGGKTLHSGSMSEQQVQQLCCIPLKMSIRILFVLPGILTLLVEYRLCTKIRFRP